MFGYFRNHFYDPFLDDYYNDYNDEEDYYNYYNLIRRNKPIRIYHPFNLITEYFNNLENRMNSIFQEEFNNMIENKSKEENKSNENKEEENKSKENKEENKNKEIKTKEEIKKPEIYSKIYSIKNLIKNNQKFEEIREIITDEDKTYNIKIKRIGNRWVQIDNIINKEGKKITKETWHNVSEDEINKFEEEWSLRKNKIKLIKNNENENKIENNKKPSIKNENENKENKENKEQ